MFFCFFFQAEDGIRDLTVTGVQTCALPISSYGTWSTSKRWPTIRIMMPRSPLQKPPETDSQSIDRAGLDWQSLESKVARSEERRVGKECRSRWSPYH